MRIFVRPSKLSKRLVIGLVAGEGFSKVIDFIVLDQVVQVRAVCAALILLVPLRQSLLFKEFAESLKDSAHTHIAKDYLSSVGVIQELYLVIILCLSQMLQERDQMLIEGVQFGE